MRLHKAWSAPRNPGAHQMTVASCAPRSSTASQARDSITSRTTVLDHTPATSPALDGLQDKETA